MDDRQPRIGDSIIGYLAKVLEPVRGKTLCQRFPHVAGEERHRKVRLRSCLLEAVGLKWTVERLLALSTHRNGGLAGGGHRARIRDPARHFRLERLNLLLYLARAGKVLRTGRRLDTRTCC